MYSTNVYRTKQGRHGRWLSHGQQEGLLLRYATHAIHYTHSKKKSHYTTYYLKMQNGEMARKGEDMARTRGRHAEVHGLR